MMDDYYLVEEDGGSDYGNDYSSDEDEWIQGLMESEERDEPNFDEEMEAERKKRCDPRTMSSSGLGNSDGCRPSSTGGSQEEKKRENQKGEKDQKDAEDKKDVVDDDGLFYDPDADDDDEKWAEKKRNSYLYKPENNHDGASSSGMSAARVTESDAVLNCPGCMSLLCMDCQRHEIYKTQYRAMFGFNCTVDFSKKLEPKRGVSKSRGVVRKRGDNRTQDDERNFFETRCSICNTQVAVYDDHEVYHFFNVLSSFT